MDRRRWQVLVVCGAAVLGAGRAPAQPAASMRGVDLANARTVPMRDVSVRAQVNADRRHVHAVVSSGISTPFGLIPLRSAIDVHVDCRGEFEGTIAFHPFVRLLALIKGIALATNVAGRVLPACDTACLTLHNDTVSARAHVERKDVAGVLRRAADSVQIHGVAWMIADTAYHGWVNFTHPTGSRELFVTVFERGRAARARREQ